MQENTSGRSAKFWGKYLKEAEKQWVKDDARRWYVRRVEVSTQLTPFHPRK